MKGFGLLPALLCLLALVSHSEAGAADSGSNSEDPQSSELESESIDTSNAYQDVYLLDGGLLPDEAYSDEDENLVGRRYFSTELVVYKNETSSFGDEMEQGARLRWRRETMRLGLLEADLVVSDIDRRFTIDQRDSAQAMVTVRQSFLPISDTWLMNNTIGHHRTLTSDHLDGGYRVNLPSSPLLGVTSDVSDTTRSAQLFVGRTGQVVGVALNQFEEDGGTLFGGSFKRQITPQFSAFGKAVSFSGNEFIREHTSLLTAAGINNAALTSFLDLSLLADDDSNFGAWADAEHIFNNNTRMRFGLFMLDENLAWMDKPIANDEFGAYVRADMQTDSYNLALGYDYIKTGIGSSLLSSSEIHNAYFNSNFRLTRNLSLGTSGTVGSRSRDDGLGDEDLTWYLNNYAYYRSPFGTSRLEYFFGETDRGLDADLRRTLGFLISHDWRMPQSMRLSTEVRVEEEEAAMFTTLEREASVNFRLNLSDELSWGLNASYFSNTSDQVESYDGVSANADFLWTFAPNWFASLIVSRNAAQFDPATNLPPPTPMVDNDTSGNTFWLTIGYGKASGQPIRAIGGGDGIGTARIQGEVFYDENGDYIRQPNEAPVVGAVVLLDGRYETRTDSLGRYLFEPVRAGSHYVALAVSELPLPWGLRDETPQMIDVGLRRYGEVNFAVVRLDETIAAIY